MATTTVEQYEKGKLYNLPLALIHPNTKQMRTHFDEEALANLAQSIAVHGVMEPIVVYPDPDQPGTFCVAAGYRRCLAAPLAMLSTIPAILTDGEPEEVMLVENLVREPCTAIEKAEALEALRVKHGYQPADLLNRINLGTKQTNALLSLNKLPDSVKDDLRNNPGAPIEVLSKIAQAESRAKMVALYKKYKDKGLITGEVIEKEVQPAKQAEEKEVDVSFVSAFSKKVDGVALGKLKPTQLQSMKDDMVTARSTIDAVLKHLDDLLAAQPSS
ncbi:ParB/RepB/Spo0J family partition protein [Geomonas sp. Red32]|uniref:ParB/RepB/Spo0J family partition protein n=1 Tax=Geomonas sp. Red32 TaxID=2912856 RepID=UPI00202CC0C4|nr:ParB/RepB/Spo0J family partition protein [Geomonas sp. Red32]MCM0083163.1 ParB/RepB/Spo0J family partition protein [Geomonas sp. Red32]